MKLHMHQTLVCVHNLLHRDSLIAVEYERRLGVIILKHLPVILKTHSLSRSSINTRKNSPRKITPQRHEINYKVRHSNRSCKILLDLCKVLMCEQLVD